MYPRSRNRTRFRRRGARGVVHISTATGQDLAPRTPSDASSEKDSARLFEELYLKLRELAATFMRGQRDTHTLQTTALVNEAYVRLSAEDATRWKSKGHFMAVAARAMRHTLVDHARAKMAEKRKAPGMRIHLDGLVTSIEQRSADILDLDEQLSALEKMGEDNARAVHVVELRFLCGLTMPEIAEALGVGVRTVERDWRFARHWLAKRLK